VAVLAATVAVQAQGAAADPRKADRAAAAAALVAAPLGALAAAPLQAVAPLQAADRPAAAGARVVGPPVEARLPAVVDRPPAVAAP